MDPLKNGKSEMAIPENIHQVEVSKKRKRNCWTINKKTLPYKLNFFLFIGGMGAVAPFLSAFGIYQLGLTATNLSAAFGAQQFLFIFLKPFIGFLTDYYNRLKASMIILTVAQALFCFLLISIPKVDVSNILKSNKLEFDAKTMNMSDCFVCVGDSNYENESSKELFEKYLKRGVICSLYTHTGNDMTLVGYASVNNTRTRGQNSIAGKTQITECEKLSKIVNETDNPCLSTEETTPNALEELNSMQTMCLQTVNKNLTGLKNSSFPLKENCFVILYDDSIQLSFAHSSNPPTNYSCSTKLSHHSTHFEYSSESEQTLYIFRTYQFWLYAAFQSLACICISSIFTMSDTACHEAIKDLGSDFGRTRCWGAFSWGLVAPLAGFLNDYTEGYVASWALMAVFCSLQIWNLTRMNLTKPDMGLNFLGDMKAAFRSLEFVAFEIGVLMNGILTGIVWFYITVFLISIGGNKLIIGLDHTIQCFAGEIPFMFCADWLTEKLGHFHIVTLALLAHAARFFLYSYIHNPWLVLPVDILHGLSFGSFYSAMTSYAKLNAKPGTEATMQSILCTTFEAMGSALGGIIFGACFDKFGGHSAFFYAAGFSLLATGINLIFSKALRCREGTLNVSTSKPVKY